MKAFEDFKESLTLYKDVEYPMQIEKLMADTRNFGYTACLAFIRSFLLSVPEGGADPNSIDQKIHRLKFGPASTPNASGFHDLMVEEELPNIVSRVKTIQVDGKPLFTLEAPKEANEVIKETTRRLTVDITNGVYDKYKCKTIDKDHFSLVVGLSLIFDTQDFTKIIDDNDVVLIKPVGCTFGLNFYYNRPNPQTGEDVWVYVPKESV